MRHFLGKNRSISHTHKSTIILFNALEKVTKFIYIRTALALFLKRSKME